MSFTVHQELPGWWWNDALLVRDQALLHKVKKLEDDARQDRRQWMITKAVDSAQRKVRRACARLTRMRLNALQARRQLVSNMFDHGRGILDVGRAVLALVRRQADDPRQELYLREILYYQAVAMEWADGHSMWS
ncbi:unnamed protein product [Peniophora sp. CBMAI 1063]|nr:unnamed protein product [Peniophora sp. CBMAI 1063]